MKLPDANILLYAVNKADPHHAAAARWMETQLSSAETTGFAWVALLAFIRLGTHPALFPEPMSVAEAFGHVARWLDQPNAVILHPTARHAVVVRELLEAAGTAGNLTTDAHLAALSIEHGAEMCSGDWDFSRFPGARWVNPLQ